MTAPYRARHAGVAGPLAALLLVVAIAWLIAEVLPAIRVEARLRRAATLMASNPIRGFAALEKGSSAEKISRRQQERGADLAREAVDRVCEGRPLLKMVGAHPFDPGSTSRPYVTASRDMMLTFELPRGLRDLGAQVRVSDGVRELCEVRFSEDGTQGRGEVPLPNAGTVVADVDLVCPVGVYGTVTSPIARALQFSHQAHGPTVKVRAGTRLDALKEGEPLRLQVARGTPLRLELADELGLGELQWTLDGVAHDPFDWSEKAESSTGAVDLPPDLTAEPSASRVLEFKASNSIGTTTRVVVELLVREPSAAPVVLARVEAGEIKDGSTMLVGEKSLTLTVTMAKGELPEDLAVLWGDRPQKTHVNGRDVSALLEAESEGPRALSLSVRGNTVLRATIRFDWTPPVVKMILDPGTPARELEVHRGVHDVPIGSILELALFDLGGLHRELTEWSIDAELEEIADPDAASRPVENVQLWTRRFRSTRCGDVRLRVGAWDLAGNRSTIHEYRVRVADPMEGRTIMLNGRPFVRGGVAHSRETRFTVRSEGGIDIDGLVFSLLDPEQRNAPLGQTTLERGDVAGVRTGIVDLSFVATSGRKIIGILSRNERELLRGDVIVDFTPPTFKVISRDEAGAGDEALRYFGKGGDHVSLTLTDDVEVDVTTISALQGAYIVHVQPGKETAVILELPAVIEEAVVLSASDLAGNHGEIRFEIVAPPEPGSQPASRRDPASRPSTDPQSAPEVPSAKLADLAGRERFTHPLLGPFSLVPVKEPGVPFYIGERELTVKDWRAFLQQMQGAPSGSRDDPKVARQQAIAAEAARLLARNTRVLKKDDDEPLAGATAELVKAYVGWANVVAGDQGSWRVPTAVQWKLAAGRALHPEAVYPTTASSPNGADLTNEGTGGAFFGHDYLTAQEMPKRDYAAGAFFLRGMAGSLYEWVSDAQGAFRLIGGSAVSPKEACRLDAHLRSGIEVADYERGFRLVLIPRAK
jgi:hypothetical protein